VSDWRDVLLRRFSFPRFDRLGRNPIGWPGYAGGEVVRYAIGELDDVKVVAAVWDFSTFGGSFGEVDATAFAEAAEHALLSREPLVSFVRSGGVRLQEGMAGLVGMPRAQLALRRLADAGVPHLAIADDPTTGGVLISVVTRADLRAVVAGSTVGFAGPRVAEAVTGEPLPAGSHTATSAYGAGIFDAVLDPDRVGDWLGRSVRALMPVDRSDDTTLPVPAAGDLLVPREGDEQVATARSRHRVAGRVLLDRLVPDGVDLRAARGDETMRAVVGHLPSGLPVVGVALAADRGGRPTPDGYALLVRAARLAGRLARTLVTVVDTPGAEPGAVAEASGIASAIGDTMDAVLGCPAPTLAVVTGEGGSGGALAAAVCDRVLVTPGCYFAALGPEGAAAALRTTPGASARRLRLRPGDLLDLGFADAAVPEPDDDRFVPAVTAHAEELAALPADSRRTARVRRWSAPLPGRLT
jgi:acyl-CoA carboxylase subunit beta